MDDEYIQKRFYNELPIVNEIRWSCGFTWRDLAAKMGCSVMTLSRWNGGSDIPLHQRVKLREILDRYRRV